MAGKDCRIMEKSTTRSVTVTGVTDGVIDSPLCTASAVVNVLDEDGKNEGCRSFDAPVCLQA